MEGHGRGHVGFRFHPTEHEIITYFLERKMRGLDFPVHTIQDIIDVCMYEPWELPERSPMPGEDRLWYFFNAPVKCGKGMKRTTNSGYWKSTGDDRQIMDEQGKKIGTKKNLVFYKGRSPHGKRTNWVMHEYRSLRAASFRKEYVLLRLKRKSGPEPDSGNRATENNNTQINHDDPIPELLIDNDTLDDNLLAELLSEEGTSNSNGFDHNTLSSLMSTIQQEQQIAISNALDEDSLISLLPMVQLEQGTLYSDGFSNELIDYFLEASDPEDAFIQPMSIDEGEWSGEQEDAFVNSLLTEEGGECCEISVKTLLHDSNPTKPLSGVYAGDSSDTDTEMFFHKQGGMSLSSKGGTWKGYRNMANFREHNESSYSSGSDPNIELDISPVNSDTDLPSILCLDRVVDESPTSTRTWKSVNSDTYLHDICFSERVVDELPTNSRTYKAHNTPKSHKLQCCTRELQLQSEVAHEAVSSKAEVREAAEHAIDLPQRKNSHVMIGKDKQMVRLTGGKTSSKSSSSSSRNSNGSDCINTKASFIFLETRQLTHKTNPPSVFLRNVLVSLVLIIFFISEMVYLH